MAEVLFRAKLVREGASTPWGFRLQGGVEYDKPLTLLKVVPESLAAKGGLHPGDIVVKLAGKSADDMTHKDAQEAIISAANTLEIIVERAEVTITSSPNSPPEKAPNGIVSMAPCVNASENSGPPSENPGQPSAISGTGTSKQEAASLSSSSVVKDGSEKNEVIRKSITEVLHNEIPKHEEVTVNSFTDIAGAMSPTNNNVKGMVNLESCTDNSLLGKDHNTLSPLPSTTIRNTNTENAKEVHIKSDHERVGPDNNVSLDKSIEGSSNSKHKELCSSKDTAPGSSSESDSQVAVSAVICDNTPDPREVQDACGHGDARECSQAQEGEGGLESQEASSVPKEKAMEVSPDLEPEQASTENSHFIDKMEGQLLNSLPESVSSVPSSDVVDEMLSQKTETVTLAVKESYNAAIKSLPDKAEGHAEAPSSPEASKGVESTCKSEVCSDGGEKSTTGNCDTNDTASSERVMPSTALNTPTVVDTSAESASEHSNSSIKQSDRDDVLSNADKSQCSRDTSELKKSTVTPSSKQSDCISEPDSNDNKVEPKSVSHSSEPSRDASQNTVQNPTVIKEFQSGVSDDSHPSSAPVHPATVTQQPEAPSAAAESPRDHPSADVPTVSNIPSSVPTCVEHEVQQSPATVAMVLTEVPKPHIQAYVVSEISKKEEKEQSRSPTEKSDTSKTTKRSSTPLFATKGEKKPGSITPITITNLKGVPLAQTVLKTPEPLSRQTKAPTEEIIIAPKPSVQILPGHDQKDSAKVPSGEQHLVEKPDSKPVSHEMKDFSKTAPWRVPKQTAQQAPPSSQGSEHHVLHPWRKSRTEHIMSHSLDDRQLSAATGRLTPTPDGTVIQKPDVVQRTVSEFDIASSKPQSTLTYVGKRIESPPVGSPVGTGAPFFKVGPSVTGPPAGRDVPPSGRPNTMPISHTSTMPSMSHPHTVPKLTTVNGSQTAPQADVVTFQAAVPDLVDIQMPAVKDMVESLNSRLEAAAEKNPLIVEPPHTQELGLNYFRRSHEDLLAPTEKEIFINTPPNPHYTGPLMEDMTQHLFAPAGAGGYFQPYYDMMDTTMSPASHRRRFSLPGGSVAHRQNQRRVRFAEPLESSVIEIEPRKQRMLERLERRRFFEEEGSMSDIEDYSSASSLDAKLDRIERKNALSNASFQRARHAKHIVDSRSGDIAQVRPAESFRERVNNFEALGEPKRDDVVLSSLKPSKEFSLGPGRSGSRGFSLSIGQNNPGSISLSLTQRGAGHPQPQVALSVPSTEGHYTYTISPRTATSEPYILKYTTPSNAVGEPILTTAHVKAPSLDSAKTIHIQYPPQEGVPTIQTQLLNSSSAGPLSPPQQIIRQLAGRPGLRSPTNYSNTLQIDTSSRLQHRSPSPPHLSVSPKLQSERARLSPQRLAPPGTRLHEAPGMDQSRRASSPNQAPILGQQPFKVRQPSPANPMAYQRSASPQGIPQYRSGSPVVSMQSSSPRNVSPVNFQHPQPVRLQSTVGYPRSGSPQYNLPAPLSQAALRQPQPVGLTSVQPRALRKLAPQQQQYLQPPGYSLQQPQAPQPRYSPRLQGQPPPSYPGTSAAGAGARVPLGPLSGDKTHQLVRELLLRGPEAMGLPPGYTVPTATPAPGAQPAQSDSEEPQGMFAFLDKDFMQRFLHADPERQDGLYESETYKLVHEMDEEDDDMSSSC